MAESITNLNTSFEQPDMTRAASDFFRPIRLAPDVVNMTMGMETDHITPELLLKSSTRLLSMSRGEDKGDDRDSLAFQRVYGPSEYLPEHIQRDAGRVARQLLWKVTNKGNLDSIQTGALEDHVASVYNDSGLTRYVDGSSPMEALDNNTLITRIGEGGVGGVRMAPDEMRDINNSFLGFIDPTRAPTSLRIGLDSYLSRGVKIGSDGKMYIKALNAKTGEYKDVDSVTLSRSNVATAEYAPACLAPMTSVVVRRNGLIIEMSADDMLSMDVPMEVLSLDDDDKPTWVPVLGVHKTPYKKCYRLYMGSSFVVTTCDHKWMTLDKHGVHRLVTTENLKLKEHMVPYTTARYSHIDSVAASWGYFTNVEEAHPTKYTVDIDCGDRVFLLGCGIWTHNSHYNKEGEYAKDATIPIARGRDIIKYVDRKDVDYYLPDPNQMFSYGSANIPFASACREMRLAMGSKYPDQGIPVDEPEEPLVMALDTDTGDSINSKLGRYLGARRTKDAGVVKQVRKDRIEVQHRDGSISSYELYDNFPANQKGFLNSTPVVKAGDIVKPDQLLAYSNYTDKNGIATNGRNLRGCFLSWKGYNYEDAYVISETAAKKMAISMMGKVSLDLDKTISTKKENYVNWKPGEFSKEQLDTIDGDGVVKPGTILKPGDPVVLAMQTTPSSPGIFTKKEFKDLSTKWEHDFPGVVTDVARTRNGIRVYAKMSKPLEAGDKITNLYGAKGVLSAVLPDDQMPKDEKGNAFDVVFPPLGIISRCYDDQTEFLTKEGWKFGKDVKDEDILYCYNKATNQCTWEAQEAPFYRKEYLGTMYGAKNNMVDFLVTEGHKVFCRGKDDTRAKECHVEDIYNTDVVLPCLYIKEDTSADTACVSKNNWYTQEYNGMTYCPTVPTGYVVTRRNGKIICMGNTNPAFPYEVQLGKVAHKTGRRYKVPGFASYDIEDFVRKESKDNNVSLYDNVIDPETGRKITKVMTGYLYMTPLKHLSEGKESSRGVAAYNADGEPVRGGYEGCFVSGTPVLCSNGDYEAIEDIVNLRKSIKVKTLQDGHIVDRKVTDWFHYVKSAEDVIVITCDDDIGVTCTRNHQIYTESGDKVLAGELKIGDEVSTLYGPMKVLDIKPFSDDYPLAKMVDVYDITVEGTHKYYAGDLLVSNSKKLAYLESVSLLGHSGQNSQILRDAKLIRGQENSDFWRSLQSGEVPVMPGEPEVYRKFYAHLQGSGINVKRKPTGISIMAMTNKEAHDLSGTHEVRSSETFDAKKFTPLQGGLFATDVFGPDWNQWGYIQLDEPVPNPVMEEPMRYLLNLKQKDFEAIAKGQLQLNGKTGGTAIKEALSKIDLEALTKQTLKEYKEASKSNKDKALKRYIAAKRMLNNGVRPEDYMMDRVPVIPPKFRPITTHGDLTMVADSNYMYKQLMDARNDMRDAKDLPEELYNQARGQVYQAYKELVGVYDTQNQKLQNKEVKGLLGWALGSSSKTSAFNRKLFQTSTDTTARGVVVPSEQLDLDEVGVPYRMAKNLFKPFVVRKLVQAGHTPVDAMEIAEGDSPQAKMMLQQAMQERPVLFNRAPTLHKRSIMAFKPVLVAGHALRVNPSINAPFALDHDGNCCDYDSEILVKIPESGLDKSKSALYCNSNLTNKEVAMKAVFDSLLSLQNPEGRYARIKIGEFPRIECVGENPVNHQKTYSVPAGIKVASIDPQTGKPCFEEVSEMTIEDDSPCSSVTILGRNIIVSSNASLAVWDHNEGGLVKVTPAESKDRYIPVFKKDPTPMGKLLDRDTGYWMGALLSDGWVSDRYVGYTKLEDVKRQEFVRISRKLYDNFECREYEGKPSEKKLGPSKKVHLFGKGFADYVRKYNLYDETCEEDTRARIRKYIHEDYFTFCSEEFLWGLMSGLLDGDGSIIKNTALSKPRFSARFNTSSPGLRDSIQRLCYRLGIRYSTTVTPARNWSRESYTVCPSTCDMQKNLDKLTCIGERETAIINEWKNYPAEDVKDQIPVTKGERDMLCALFDLTHNDKGTYSALRKNMSASRKALKKYAEQFKESMPELYWRVMEDNTLWAKVDKVEDAGTRQVFDLMVGSTKVFAINNGVIIYDTANIHVPVSKKAVEEALHLMLPSQNLIGARFNKLVYPVEREHLQGLYMATRMNLKQKPVHVTSIEEARQMYRDNKLDIDTPITIG